MAGICGVAAQCGCASRTVTITQADRINTRVQIGREPALREGEPLEVNIVCVYPCDLKKDRNALLAPDKGITSAVWYARRPEVGKLSDAERFDLPARQIYLLTDDTECFGTPKGPRLRGAKKDGKKEIKITGIAFKEKRRFSVAGSLFDPRAVIYVFPKFLDEHENVLPVLPAKFSPPGDYYRHLGVEIGVLDPGKTEEQYIKPTTPRRLNKRRDKEHR
ncbi:MAG: hypothetical protein ACE5HE_13640 [Phycisphaerae bacterium]